jgi:hypothetical protein
MTALIRIDSSWTGEHGRFRSKPIRFCSRCGHPEAERPKRPELLVRERVCRRCGMGLMLSCSRDALPGEAAAFLVVSFELAVSAVSEAGEKVFGAEQSLIGTSLLEVLESPVGNDALVRYVSRATQRGCPPIVLPVRLASGNARRVGTMAARIATCGPPRAALVTVEPSEFGRR